MRTLPELARLELDLAQLSVRRPGKEPVRIESLRASGALEGGKARVEKLELLAGSNRVELRFDVFNLLNRTNVSTVNNIIGLNPQAPPATFGTITGVRDQRQAQVAVRYRF